MAIEELIKSCDLKFQQQTACSNLAISLATTGIIFSDDGTLCRKQPSSLLYDC